MSTSATPDSAAPLADSRAELALEQSLVVLAPLVRWLLDSGVHYGALAQALKGVFLAEARRDLHKRGSKVTDSALSVLSGVHRKDVRAFAERDAPAAVYTPSSAVILFTRWVTDVRYREFVPDDPVARPLRRLPRHGAAPSFEALAREVSSDVHPRTLLEELQRLGLVQLDGEFVLLQSERFVSRPGDASAAQTLAVNVADHLSAAVHNLTAQDGGRLLEQSVYASGLSLASGARLAEAARQLWTPAFEGMVAAATDCVQLDDDNPDTPVRMRFGVYYYHETDDGRALPAGPAAVPSPSDQPPAGA
ncbi:MAG: DUF6502 family protein [Leptothrix sp. (in: b-proteobacteria)]